MPNIRTFEAPQEALQPTDRGPEAVAATARRGGAFFHQAAAAEASIGQHIGSALKDAGDAAVNYMQHREISAGAPHLAQIEDSQTGVWMQTLANKSVDWNDPTIAQQFRASMEPTLQKFKDSFLTEGGRDWAEKRVEDFRKHMFAKTAADTSTMAGAAVAQNLEQSVISYSNRVFKDPGIETLNDALNSFHGAAEASVYSSPTLEAGSRASLLKDIFKQDEKIVKSAIEGAILNNGDWRKIADDPRFTQYISGPELAQFARKEEAQERAIRAQERAAQVAENQERREKGAADVNKAFTDNIEIDEGTGLPRIKPNFFKDTLRAMTLNPNAPNATELGKTHMSWGEAELRRGAKQIVSDPTTLAGLTSRVFDPNNPTTRSDLMKAQLASDGFPNGKLSGKDFAKLDKIVTMLEGQPRDPVFHSAIKAAEKLIGTDPVGSGKFSEFVSDFWPKYQAMRRAGTLPDNWNNMNDPKSMIRQSMEGHMRTPAERMHDQRPHGVTAPVTPIIKTKEQYDALPSGQVFIGSDGKQYTKP